MNVQCPFEKLGIKPVKKHTLPIIENGRITGYWMISEKLYNNIKNATN